MDHPLFWRDEKDKLSDKEKKFGNQIFFMLMLIIVLLGLVFLVSRVFHSWLDIKAIPMNEMQVTNHIILAEGNTANLMQTENAVYFTLKDGTSRKMPRTIPSWEPAVPTAVGAAGDELIAVKADDSEYFYVNAKNGKIVVASEEGDIVKHIALMPGKTFTQGFYLNDDLYAETTDGTIAAYDADADSWTEIAEGSSVSASGLKDLLYYVRDGVIYRYSLKDGTEEEVIKGDLAAVSDNNKYLVYVAKDETSGLEEIYMVNPSKPDEKCAISAHSTYSADAYTEITYDSENAMIFAVLESGEVRAYTVANQNTHLDRITSDWLEGWVTQNGEAMIHFDPTSEYTESLEELSVNGLGIAAPEGYSGIYKNGQYQTIFYQQLNEKDHYVITNCRAYAENQNGTYAIAELLNMETRESAEVRGTLADQYKNAVLIAEDYAGTTQYLLTPTEEEDIYTFSIMKDDMPMEFPVTLPEGAVPTAISMGASYNIGAVQYKLGDEENIVLLNLHSYSTVETPFLCAMQRFYWRNSVLVVYSGDEDLSVRWIYAPSAGTLTLFEQAESHTIF